MPARRRSSTAPRVAKRRCARRRLRRGRRAERLARPRPRVTARSRRWTKRCVAIQRDLFALGAQLADPADKLAPRVTKAVIADDDVARLEQLIDRLEDELPPLRRFILPAARRRAPRLHVARTVCRRAERRIVALDPPVDAGARALRQPPVRPALRARARRQSPRRCARRPSGDHASYRRGAPGRA